MENLDWYPFYYNGFETNVEINKLGQIKKVYKNWATQRHQKYGILNFDEYKSQNRYYAFRIQVKSIGSIKILVHKLIAHYFLNHKLNNKYNEVVDHIDGDIHNNSYDNLRLVSNRENTSIQRTIKSGLPVGVCWNKNAKKYQANLRYNGKRLFLGYYNNIESASQAYQNKLKSL